MVGWKDRVRLYSYTHFSAGLILPTSSFPLPNLLEAVQSSKLSWSISTSDLDGRHPAHNSLSHLQSTDLTLALSWCRQSVEMTMTRARKVASRSQEEPGNIIL